MEDKSRVPANLSLAKGFESERLYENLGALLVKRYVPTGGDAVMQHLRRYYPEANLVNRSLQSLSTYECGTRLAEAIHLFSFVGFAVVGLDKFLRGRLASRGWCLV